jgi:hypothetical protein
MKRLAAVLVPACLTLAIGLAAQSKSPATFADFGKWEVLAPAGARGGLSPDGRFAAYAINRSNRNNELVVATLADGTKKVIAFGAQPAFSADSKWLACSVGMSEADQERLRAEQKPAQNKMALLNLATGEMTTTDVVESFSFSADGSYLAVRPYGPEAAAPAAAAARAGANRRRPPRSGREPPSSCAISPRAERPRSATSPSSPGRTATHRTCSRWRSAPRTRRATACSCSTRPRAS